jgi:hypothetical protein
MRVVARPERAEKSEKFYRFIGFWSAPEHRPAQPGVDPRRGELLIGFLSFSSLFAHETRHQPLSLPRRAASGLGALQMRLNSSSSRRTLIQLRVNLELSRDVY